MQFTVVEVLYLVLIFVFLLMAVMISIFIWQLTKVIGNIEKITDKVDQIVGHADKYVQIPLGLIQGFIEKMKNRKKKDEEE